MDTALKLLSVLGNVFSAIKVAGGGPLYWIAAIFFCILALIIGVALQKIRNKKAWEDSQIQTQKDQGEGKLENNQTEAAADKAEAKIEEIVKKEPDTEKIQRPRD